MPCAERESNAAVCAAAPQAEVESAEKKASRGRKSGGKDAGGKGAKKGGAKAGGEASDAAAGVRKLTSPSGWPVFVGRNSRGNETVSHVLAKDTDVWFHLRGLPGAHVILRVPPGKARALPGRGPPPMPPPPVLPACLLHVRAVCRWCHVADAARGPILLIT